MLANGRLISVPFEKVPFGASFIVDDPNVVPVVPVNAAIAPAAVPVPDAPLVPVPDPVPVPVVVPVPEPVFVVLTTPVPAPVVALVPVLVVFVAGAVVVAVVDVPEPEPVEFVLVDGKLVIILVRAGSIALLSVFAVDCP